VRMACGSHQKLRCSSRGLPSDRASGLKRRASYFNGVSTCTADQIVSRAYCAISGGRCIILDESCCLVLEVRLWDGSRTRCRMYA
jgi:hypothetical protein